MQLESWLKQQPQIKTVYVDHGELIANPAMPAAKLNQFLGNALDIEAMAKVVDPSLYRQRS